ncbi:MAG: class I SAM-dependent methyltransferase [Nannocystaceae bacterium]|nr:class I SAM-dependent methyltransferase [Myxococcales bacterium]
MAEEADLHALYERAVQDPPGDVRFFSRTFKKLRGYKPISLREDFCGTASLCLAWARSGSERTAIGVDLSQETMDWGRARIDAAGRDYGERIELVCADVRDPKRPRVDVACALNFSYCVFKTRAELLEYFTAARGGLARDGVFFLDLLGGTESMCEDVTDNEHDGFIYRWEQERFNVITHEVLCHIHFLFPDGSKLDRAFTYDWRLWTAPELRELLLEAGFRKVHFYWEKVDADGEGTGNFGEPDYVENQEVWWTYMAAER